MSKKKATTQTADKKQEQLPAIAENTALATQQDTAALQQAFGVEGGIVPGMEDIGPEDVSIPRIRVIQAPSAENNLDDDDPDYKPLGTIVRSDTGEILREYKADKPIQLLPILVAKGRIAFDDDGNMIARSHDSRNHDLSLGERDDKITECAKCPDAKWTKNEEGKRVPPICGLQYVFPSLLLDVVDAGAHPISALVLVIFSKTSFKSGKKYVELTKFSGLPLYAFKMHLSQHKEVEGSRTWSVLDVARGPQMQPDHPAVKWVMQEFDKIKAMRVSTVADADTAAPQESAGDDAGEDAPWQDDALVKDGAAF